MGKSTRSAQAFDLRTAAINANVEGHPDKCPRCHRHVAAVLVATRVVKTNNTAGIIEEVLQCTSSLCESLFIAIYKAPPTGGPYSFTTAIPMQPCAPKIPQELLDVSPTFGEVYSQALAADAFGLDQLTGIGLRKALEFLVKDFAIAKAPDDEEKGKVRRKSLGDCIKDYIADASVKEVARRATWLGNDETHYIRKWTDFDIRDLKALIQLTMHGLANVLIAERYIDEMKTRGDGG